MERSIAGEREQHIGERSALSNDGSHCFRETSFSSWHRLMSVACLTAGSVITGCDKEGASGSSPQTASVLAPSTDSTRLKIEGEHSHPGQQDGNSPLPPHPLVTSIVDTDSGEGREIRIYPEPFTLDSPATTASESAKLNIESIRARAKESGRGVQLKDDFKMNAVPSLDGKGMVEKTTISLGGQQYVVSSIPVLKAEVSAGALTPAFKLPTINRKIKSGILNLSRAVPDPDKRVLVRIENPGMSDEARDQMQLSYSYVAQSNSSSTKNIKGQGIFGFAGRDRTVVTNSSEKTQIAMTFRNNDLIALDLLPTAENFSLKNESGMTLVVSMYLLDPVSPQ